MSDTEGQKKVLFTETEKVVLASLVAHYPEIEDKRNDNVSLERKRRAWEELTKYFNMQPGVHKRSRIQLQKCLKNCKQRARKTGAGVHCEPQITACDDCSPPAVENDSMVELVLVEGIPRSHEEDLCPWDSDATFSQTSSSTVRISEPPDIKYSIPEVRAATVASTSRLAGLPSASVSRTPEKIVVAKPRTPEMTTTCLPRTSGSTAEMTAACIPGITGTSAEMPANCISRISATTAELAATPIPRTSGTIAELTAACMLRTPGTIVDMTANCMPRTFVTTGDVATRASATTTVSALKSQLSRVTAISTPRTLEALCPSTSEISPSSSLKRRSTLTRRTDMDRQEQALRIKRLKEFIKFQRTEHALKVEAERMRAEAERQRGEAEKQRADAERQRAEAERQRAEAERIRKERYELDFYAEQ